jgi:tripartite-type tricarboxylate transporter receptor subunit TctC
MKFPRRRFLHLAAGAAALPGVSRIARAQAFPTRPITLVVPFAAGGPGDTIARVLTPRLSEVLGQQVIVENVVGAGGMTGVSRVARPRPTAIRSGSAISVRTPTTRRSTSDRSTIP